jgi:hypothetical protein
MSPVLATGAIGYGWMEVEDTTEMAVPVDAIIAALKMTQPTRSTPNTYAA